jgi:hypothetical protein
MSTKSGRVIYGGRITGAKIGAQGAREAAQKAKREADRAEAEALVDPDGGLWQARAAIAYHHAVAAVGDVPCDFERVVSTVRERVFNISPITT